MTPQTKHWTQFRIGGWVKTSFNGRVSSNEKVMMILIHNAKITTPLTSCQMSVMYRRFNLDSTLKRGRLKEYVDWSQKSVFWDNHPENRHGNAYK